MGEFPGGYLEEFQEKNFKKNEEFLEEFRKKNEKETLEDFFWQNS